MIINYFKIALRHLMRNKLYSFINITGLATGMACTILILLWVWDEMSFDSFNENRNEIYRILSDWEKWDWNGLPISPEPLGPACLDNIPDIENMFRIIGVDRVVFKRENKIFYENGGIIVDPSIFSIFSFPFISGNPNNALLRPESVVISERLAHKYFGIKDPVGEIVEIDGKLGTVTGVFKTIPQNSHLQFDFALNFEFINEYSNYGTGWNAFNFTTYVLLNENESINLHLIGDKITKVALDQECNHVKEGVTFRL